MKLMDNALILEKEHEVAVEAVDDGRSARRRLAKWRLQRAAQLLLPEERVAFCMRRPQSATVDVMFSPQRCSAHFNGLMTCGSVWVCPMCASRISERRRDELEQAVTRCVANGGAVYLATYTVSHDRFDTLSDLLAAFLAARKKSRQGRAAQALRKEFGVLGTVSVREVTWSKVNGWHPHCHELIFFASNIDEIEYERAVRLQWQKSAEQFGLQMNERGFQFDRTFGAVADYVAKFGREPQDTVWSAATEVTKSHLKQGRGDEHLTPFGLLERIAQGETEYESVFLEYAQWFKGKHQLVWSAGLRTRLLGNNEVLSDEESAQAALSEDDSVCLGKLQRSQWNLILKYEARGMLLEVARYGEWTLVLDFLYCLEIDGLPFPFY